MEKKYLGFCSYPYSWGLVKHYKDGFKPKPMRIIKSSDIF